MMQDERTPEQSEFVKLAIQCVMDSEKWFPDVNNIPHHTLALCGEVGELANIVKKIERGSLDFSDQKVRWDMMQELTDVFIYLLNIAGLLKMDLTVVYDIKRAENVKRFGNV